MLIRAYTPHLAIPDFAVQWAEPPTLRHRPVPFHIHARLILPRPPGQALGDAIRPPTLNYTHGQDTGLLIFLRFLSLATSINSPPLTPPFMWIDELNSACSPARSSPSSSPRPPFNACAQHGQSIAPIRRSSHSCSWYRVYAFGPQFRDQLQLGRRYHWNHHRCLCVSIHPPSFSPSFLIQLTAPIVVVLVLIFTCCIQQRTRTKSGSDSNKTIRDKEDPPAPHASPPVSHQHQFYFHLRPPSSRPVVIVRDRAAAPLYNSPGPITEELPPVTNPTSLCCQAGREKDAEKQEGVLSPPVQYPPPSYNASSG